jgi:phosphoribosyl-ATP pyrophosphohydrolase/phosphoribosyl-AMP cyclohydrolase
LERLTQEREVQRPEGSYTTQLFDAGVKRIAQKVGEEGVETALAANVVETLKSRHGG